MLENDKIKLLIQYVIDSWQDSGECNSCNWHASLSEYDLPEDMDIDWNKGEINMSCKSKDDENRWNHRGVTIYFDPSIMH